MVGINTIGHVLEGVREAPALTRSGVYLKISGSGLPTGPVGGVLQNLSLDQYRDMMQPPTHNQLPVGMADELGCKVTCWGPACAGDGRFQNPGGVEDTRYVDVSECRCEQMHLRLGAALIPNGVAPPPHPAIPGALPEQPATYTPAKAPVQASDPEEWPAFPGERLPYRGSLDPDHTDVVGPNDHMGGPR